MQQTIKRQFFRRLIEDITADIYTQKRVSMYVNRMYNDKLIDEKN